jgi:hypothetical protein
MSRMCDWYNWKLFVLNDISSQRIKCLVWSLYHFTRRLGPIEIDIKYKGKAIPVTGREGPYGCETSRLPHFVDSRLTGGGEFVSLTRRSPFTPRKIPGTHFC